MTDRYDDMPAEWPDDLKQSVATAESENRFVGLAEVEATTLEAIRAGAERKRQEATRRSA